jgi:cytokinesis protein
MKQLYTPLENVLIQKISLTPYRTDWSNKAKDAALRKVEKDPDELSKYDRIYLELFFNLDRYWKARMRGLQLRRNFHGMYDDFRKKLGIIQEASQGLRNSTSFRELLDVFDPPSKIDDRSYWSSGII